ncbi:MAG TPA: hypothetical protein V6D02_08430 [Candidatus Obscuribacterales bacterium]
MSHIAHRYEVKVMRSNASARPIVRGYEEVNVNGKRQVRYFDETALSPSDRWLDPWLDESFSPLLSPWLEPFLPASEVAGPRPSMRVIHPDTATKSAPQVGQFAPRQWGQKMRRLLGRVGQKIRRLAHNLPVALKTAWRELNQ